MKVFLVHNPVAGKHDPEAAEATFGRHFSQNGSTYRRLVTGRDDMVSEIVREAVEDGFDLVAAAGGDGTVSEVANGLVGTQVPLGIVPLGSGNTLARELGIPLKTEAALALLTGPHRQVVVDTLVNGGRHFLMSLSVGLSSNTVVSTGRDQKRWLGKAAYFFQGLATLFGWNPRRFSLLVDDRRVTTRAAEILVANTGLIGFRQVRLSPEIEPDDGKMHVCIIRAASLGGYLKVLWRMLRGGPDGTPEVRCLPAAREVVIEPDKPMYVQGDGDVIGMTPITIGIAPQSTRLVIPR